MKRKEIIKLITQILDGEEAIISSTGLMSRELFNMADSARNFYMTGSMGLASSLGLGIAVNKPGRQVVVIEGDASLLMNLGSLGTIGRYEPENLIHIILDNNAYASCAEERSISNAFKLDKVAEIAGYNKVRRVKTEEQLKNTLKDVLDERKGPVFILIEMELGGRRDLPRPMTLDKISDRFQSFLVKNNGGKGKQSG